MSYPKCISSYWLNYNKQQIWSVWRSKLSYLKHTFWPHDLTTTYISNWDLNKCIQYIKYCELSLLLTENRSSLTSCNCKRECINYNTSSKITIHFNNTRIRICFRCSVLFWRLSVAVDAATRMRIFNSLTAAMASSLAVCRLHMSGRGKLVKGLQKVDTFLQRSIGTNVASQAETPRKDETGQ